MKTKLLIVYFVLIYYPLELLSQTGLNEDNVIISGKILDFQNSKKRTTINFYFRDILNRDLQNTYVSEIDSLGNFSIKIPIYYPQDFNIDFGTQLICSPGDSLIIRINVKNETIYVVGGNRLKDNTDFNNFINGINNIDNTKNYDLAKDKTSSEFSQYLITREDKYRDFLNDFKSHNNTSSLFNRFADDYLKYDTWQALLSYPEWFAEQNNIKKDSVKLNIDYYSFLKEYNMDDAHLISTKHAYFLHQFNRYVLRTPKDSRIKHIVYLENKILYQGQKC